MVDPRTSEWLDGPALVAWLEVQDGLEDFDKRLGFHARRIRDWKRGVTAHVYTADVVLTKLDLHISLIPDEVWTQPSAMARAV